MASVAGVVRVAVADDSVVIREGLAAMLAEEPGIELIGACSDGDELERLALRERPDVVITDIRMPPSGELEGIRVAARLRDADPSIGVVILSQHVEPEYAVETMSRGTSGRAYILKDRLGDTAELGRVIRTVIEGGSAIDPLVVDALMQARARERRSPLDELTQREREILAQIAEGKSNAAIAESLVLTKRAVEKHVNSIFSKLALPDSGNVSRRVKAALLFLAEETPADRIRP
ncbi:MAG: response regulator [Solirubrobacteraceae bacterium]